MIKLFNRSTEQYHSFEITIFPDKTSQVWKINPVPQQDHTFDVIWMFENEAEYVHILQLGALLSDTTTQPTLYVPYLPYARQDKMVANSLSFAGLPLVWALREVYSTISAFDCHSDAFDVENTEPKEFFTSVLSQSEYTAICYPDKGALLRYHHLLGDVGIGHVHFEKIRNQETGEITGLHMHGDDGGVVKGGRILIVDDLCDGGMTFIKVSQELYHQGAKEVDLCVSHGVFSKGKECLYHAGIQRIFTTNSRLNNPNGYPVVAKEIHHG